MTDVDILSQYVNSMLEAVEKLEEAEEKKSVVDVRKIKLFIMDIHRRISVEVGK